MLLALIVAVTVVVVAVWYVYPRSSEHNSPEGTVRDMIDAMNRRDGRDFVSQTTLMLENPTLIDNEISDLEQGWAEDDNPELKIVSLEVIEKDQMSAEVSQNFIDIASLFESVYLVDVEDYCGVHLSATVASGGGAILESDIALFKIDSIWYAELYLDPWEDETL